MGEKKIPDNSIIKAYRKITKLMINQRNEIIKNPLNGEFQKHNFSHGDLYLHANEKRAALFAKYHIHGSEILNRIISYLNILDSEDIEYNSSKYCGDLDLNRIRRNKPNTYIIRFKYYNGLNLELEDRHEKNELDAILNDKKSLMKRIGDPNFNSRLQLKTNDIIESKRLIFFQLRINPDPEEEFDYVLIK